MTYKNTTRQPMTDNYDLTSRRPADYVTIKTASHLTGMTANAIRVAGYAGRIDMVRTGSGGWSANRRHHNEVSLRSLFDYIESRDPRGRTNKKLRNVGGRG